MRREAVTRPGTATGEPRRSRLVLVPTDRHVEHALARGHTDVDVSTWRRFLEQVHRDASAHDVASREESLLATRDALDRAARDASIAYPDDPVDRVRFVEAVDRALGTLRRSGVTAEELEELGTSRATLSARLIREVDAALSAARLIDRRGLGRAVAEHWRSGRATPGAWSFETASMARFDDDDLNALEALDEASRASGGTGVVIRLPRLVEHTGSLEELADSLEARWAHREQSPEIRWDPTPAPQIELVIDAQSPEAEARAIARVILDGARGTGDRAATPLERMAIVVPDWDDVAIAPLRRALTQAGIAFSEARGRDPLTSPEATAALSLLEMAATSVTRDQVIELLRAPGLHAGHWTQVGGEADASRRATALAHRLREVAVVSDRRGTLLVETLRELVDKKPDDAWMPGAVERFLDTIRYLRAPSTRVSLADRVAVVFDLLKLGRPSAGELGRALASEGDADGAGRGALASIAAGSAALRALREGLRRLRSAAVRLGMTDRDQGPAELLAELTAAVASAPGSASGAAGRAVAVSIVSAASLPGLGIELAIFARLSSRAYGRNPPEDPWLDDATPPAVWTQGAELAWALASAARVVLTCARASPDEDAGQPHPVVARALETGAIRRVEPVSHVRSDSSVLDPRGEELRALALGAAPPPDLSARVSAELERIAFFHDPRVPAGRFTGAVVLDDPLHLVQCVGGASPDQTIAVTAIERAAICPFAGFARRVLGVASFGDAEEAQNPRDRGTLVHRALHGALVALQAAPAAQRDLELARRAAADAVHLEGAASPLRREAMLQAIEEAVAVIAFADAEPTWRFAYSEQRFGPPVGPGEPGHAPARWPPVVLEADDGGDSVYVDGQIDRVDRTASGEVRVVDIKTGRPPSASELGRTALQLPLYAAAAAEALGVARISIGYVRVRPGGRIETSPKADSDDALSTPEKRSMAAGIARRAVERMWRGEVGARPVTASACAHCDARDVCRRPAVMPIEEDAEERP